MNFTYIGKLNTEILKEEFGELATDELILMDERDDHIKERHEDDYKLFHQVVFEVINTPDIILKDSKNNNTVFYIKYIEETNMNVVIKLVIEKEDTDKKNSIITAYQLGEKTLKRVKKKNKVLYNKE